MEDTESQLGVLVVVELEMFDTEESLLELGFDSGGNWNTGMFFIIADFSNELVLPVPPTRCKINKGGVEVFADDNGDCVFAAGYKWLLPIW